MGRAAIELLVEQTDTPDAPPRAVVFKPELVARQSTVG
jgi:LacI family transcriptional regulator